MTVAQIQAQYSNGRQNKPALTESIGSVVLTKKLNAMANGNKK